MKNKQTNQNPRKSKGRLFSEIWNYLRESKNYILFAIVIFLYTMLAALILPIPGAIDEQIKVILKELVEKTRGLGTFEMIVFLFKNNIYASFIGLFLGIILGIVPFITAVSNGYILGYVLKIVIADSGLSTLWRILPHGIFELPALVISLGLGLKLGTVIFSKNILKEFSKRLIISIKAFFILIAPLLIIAAVIEGVLINLLG